MVGNPYDPVRWGIDPVTARELQQFDGGALGRVSAGRFGEVAPPQAVSDRVTRIDSLVRSADRGGWYWETRRPRIPASRRREPQPQERELLD